MRPHQPTSQHSQERRVAEPQNIPDATETWEVETALPWVCKIQEEEITDSPRWKTEKKLWSAAGSMQLAFKCRWEELLFIVGGQGARQAVARGH